MWAVNTASAWRAAKRRPVSDDPACTSTRRALRAAREVQRPSHLVVLALVVDRPDAVGPRIAAAGAVVDDRVGGPAVPQRLDHGHELLAAGIAVRVARLARVAEVA